tara:strand:- start:7350 stop:7850 length:501 start_codon:yes stop_codon:yes gene_type:complete
MKRLFMLLFCAVLFMSATDCESKPTADKIQAKQTEKSLGDANRQIGYPAIVNFQERKLFKQILELRDSENLITYCYFFNELKGEIGQFLGKGIGYGIPAATQFTNPEKIANSYSQGGFAILPQADPNGLFMPTATSATWYMLLDGEGVPHPVFIEPLIIVSPIKLH